ncbi:ROK family protein [Acidiferrimicrobium sp. IK]|uniref:ROK family protein n=1 Tax=Acidiferrimicrobium sp. IK TaxID=2871700 RepID=UPI0021CB0268|nr:ROK family protein [Acidiferrimicrobium sp. IK]MCU4183332.1 ROK family protein [Acidiferrimicrobium sp. IK]
MTGVYLGDVVALDIGGTKVAAALVGADGVIRARTARPTPPSDQMIDVLVDLVRSLSPAPVPVGVAAPGVVDPSEGVIRSATDVVPGWAGVPVAAELRRRLQAPVAIDNDARAMAHGEAAAGAGRAHPDALYVAVGTGIGGAVYNAGKPRRGPHMSAGEIAHLMVPVEPGLDETALCGCGRRYHLEAHAAGPAIERAYRTLGGAAYRLPEIAARADDGDPLAAEVIGRAGALIGRALAGLLAAVDGSAVIVGGGVAEIGAAFLAPMAEAFRAEAIDPVKDVPVLPAQLGTSAPLIGAALLVREQLAT